MWLFACLALPCFAHRDAIITWNPDGSLDALPARYQPAALIVTLVPAEDGLQRVDTLSLELADQKVALPRCVLDPIRIRDRTAVRIVGSWYHDAANGPPYLVVEVFSADPRSTAPKRSTALHFHLGTARLLEVQAIRYAAHESTIHYSSVDFRAACAGERVDSFAEPAPGRGAPGGLVNPSAAG